MFEKERWKEIFHVLSKNKLRTFLTAFGILWGIFMLMIMLGASSGLRNGMTRQLGKFAINSCFLWTQRTTMPYKGFQKDRHFSFEMTDMALLKNKIPEIQHLSPRYQRGNTTVSRNNITESFSVYGDYPDYINIDPMIIKKGRFLNYKDLNESRKVIVIGERVREVLFNSDEKAIGGYLKVNGIYFQIIGVVKSLHTGGWGNHQNNSIILPLTSMQRAFNLGNRVGWFAITSKPGISVKIIEDKAIRILKAAHSIHPDDKMAIGHENVEEQSKKFRGLFSGISLVIWIVGLGTLLSGIVGVSNIMLVIVRERTQEFGIQRAIGATPWKITSQLILESVFLTTLAGYLGLFLGIGLVQLVNGAITNEKILDVFFNPQIQLDVAFKALAILIFSGVLAGIIPAIRAVSIKPIDAIRSEYK